MHPDDKQGASEHKSLADLEWAHMTLRKCADILQRNLHFGESLDSANLYLLTAMLWLKEGIRAQTLTVERRFGDRKPQKSNAASTPPAEAPPGSGAS